MRVLVTGATGTIGRALVRALTQRGEDVVALTRSASNARGALPAAVALHEWRSPASSPPPAAALSGAEAVVHLLGEPVAQRWGAEAKRAIRDSRVGSTQQLAGALQELPAQARPRVLVSQSATGYYGPSDARPLEETSPGGRDFLAGVVRDWEQAALAAAGAVRVVCPRTGVVLSPEGGALAKMLPFFRLGLGGPVAGGRQYVPWIHLDDVVGGIIHAVEKESLSGPVNLTAPQPVTNAELSAALGRVLHRPAVLPVPGFALKLLYGEMAQIVTTGQRVLPAALERSGYTFAHPVLEGALRDVLRRSP
jgi:uncharacterized protein (TIGR01777 family)